MRATSARSQLALRWVPDDALQWHDLPPSCQAELRALLRCLLMAVVTVPVEAGHDQ
jgi:hypothetical protein